ncbi:MAG TPA: AMP-dependent synthetase/ligase [Longimicrobiaceae bacterium]
MAETMVSVFRERAERLGDRAALRVLAAGGAPRDETVSWREWAEQARRFAAALVAAGHRPGEAVAVFAGNRLLWPVADLGTLLAGGVGVGIYPTASPEQVRQVLADCGAAVLVVDTPERLSLVTQVRAGLPGLRVVVCQRLRPSRTWTLGWEEWLARGARALEHGRGVAEELERRAARLGPDDTAVLIYTSGSTGEPRGARITHRCLLESALSIQQTLGLDKADTGLSFLPFCHGAERIFGLYTRIVCGMEAGLVEDHARVPEAARAYGPTVFGGLPRFYEKAYEALRAEEEGASGEERERWTRTLELGRARSRLRQAGEPVPAELEEEWRAAGAPLFARVSALFGGRVRRATSGGATLPGAVAEYLDALGLTVLGAYGMTEHLCVAFNRPDHYTLDSSGPPMPGTELRVAEDGEVRVRRGPLTFAGYHGRPEATRDAFTPDGEWLLTGDLGEVGPDGCLRITGRRKELIALSSGKKVAPLPIEGLLVQDPWIAQAMLYGEGRRFVTALLALRRPVVEAWARERALPHDYPDLLGHPEVVSRVQEAVDRVNAGLARPEQVRRWTLLERELSPEEDELTPTLKLRRPVVAERYRDRMEALYS